MISLNQIQDFIQKMLRNFSPIGSFFLAPMPIQPNQDSDVDLLSIVENERWNEDYELEGY